MIDINKPINAVVSSLTDSKRFNEFELARKQEADKRIAIAARSLGFI